MKPDLRTNIGGLELRNPFYAASLCPCSNVTPLEQARNLARRVDKGASAIITQMTTLKRKKDAALGKIAARSTIVESKPPFGKEGFFLACATADIQGYLDYQLEMIRYLKGLVDVPIIGNMIGTGTDENSWVELAKILEDAGCSLLELNVSCPVTDNPIDESGQAEISEGGSMVGQVPALVKKITKAVTNSVDVPVFVKMTPEVGYPDLIAVARAVEEAGGKGVTVINAPTSIAPPDIYNGGRSKYPALDKWTFGGTYGPWDRFLTYKFITAVAKYVPNLDIVAVGGNVDPEHSIEFMMLGAKTVEISSGILWRGQNSISRNIHFLEKYMEEMNYQTLDDFRGAALKYIVKQVSELEFKPAHASVDPTLCTGCGSCTEILCSAMRLENGVAVNDIEKCSGCGFCRLSCEHDAISIVYNDEVAR